MRATKDSGVDWLGEIPADWDVLPARALFRNPSEPSKPDDIHLTPSQKYGVLPQNEYMEISGSRVVLNLSGSEQMRHVEAGDFISHLRSFQGGLEYSPFEGKVSNAYTVLRPRRPFVAGYFKHLFKSTMYVQGLQTTTDQLRDGQSIRFKQLALLSLPEPPLEEQRRIADFLDRETAKIDALIAKQEQLITTLDERKQAAVSQVLSLGLKNEVSMKESGVKWLGEVPSHWDVVPIKWLTSVRRGSSPRPIDDPKYFDENGEWAWVRISDVTASKGLLRQTRETLSELGSSLSTKILPGELFVSIAGTVGMPAIADIKCCIHDGFVYFPTLTLNRKYLYRILESGRCFGGLGKLGTQLNLNTDTIGNIRVPIPPPRELDEIVEFIDAEVEKANALVARVQTAVALLLERRQALISAAVTGKLEVGV